MKMETCPCGCKVCLRHYITTKPQSEAEGHLLLWEKRRGAILGILLELEGLLGPAHRLQMHPHLHFSDISFSAEAIFAL